MPTLLTPARELVQPDLVRLERVPREVEPLRPPLARADAVLPSVAGNEVATRVADGGYAELAHQIHHVGPETVRVRGWMPGLIDPVVDAPTEVLDEGAEQAAVQRTDGVGGIDDDLCCRHGTHALSERRLASQRPQAPTTAWRSRLLALERRTTSSGSNRTCWCSWATSLSVA